MALLQRWTDFEISRYESSPDPIKLNPIKSWSAKFLKIISPIQSWSANVKSRIFILPHEAKELLKLFCLSSNWLRAKYFQQGFCLMRQNRHNLLAFPKFNKEVSIRHQKQRPFWNYFAIRRARFLELVKWQGRYTWISVRSSLHELKP